LARELPNGVIIYWPTLDGNRIIGIIFRKSTSGLEKSSLTVAKRGPQANPEHYISGASWITEESAGFFESLGLQRRGAGSPSVNGGSGIALAKWVTP